MKKQFRIVFGILLVASLGGLVWLDMGQREPAYQGKPMSVWLKDFETWDGDTNSAASVAFREMGTNAIPPLLYIIQSDGSPIQKMIIKLNRKQSIVNIPFGEPWHQTLAASYAMYVMGTNALPPSDTQQ